MEIFDAVIQGVVQGLTEFLPVSSSGHLLLAQHILGVRDNNLFFDIMLHLGTLIAVLAFYYKTVLRLISSFFGILKDVFTGNFSFKKLNDDKRMVIMLIIGLLPLFLLFLPVPHMNTNIKGLAEQLSSDNAIIVVGVSLLVTSLLLHIGILSAKKNKNRYTHLKNNKDGNGRRAFGALDAICVGITQCIAAVFPGISRSGSTLSVGLMRGINRQTALDYSFILGIPSILAAALLELKEVYDSPTKVSIEVLPVIIGVFVSAVVGFMAIKLFKWLLATDKMNIFVIYTLIIGILTLAVGILEIIKGANIFTGVPI